jgi:dienelactone hydrolase
MAHILLFHHIQGLTEGVVAFADELRAAGHEVTTPDVFGGRTFASIEAGQAFLREGAGNEVEAASDAAADAIAEGLVYGGFSLGVMEAQRLAQQRPGARGALLYHGGIPLGFFGDAWPKGVPLQAHVKRDDPMGDVEDVRALVEAADGELHLYDGDAHLFTDRSLEVYDPVATKLVLERTIAFLGEVDRTPA